MLKIKLTRTGKKHEPHYRICVAEENSKLTGTVVEVLGHYHPMQNHAISYDLDRVKHWVKLGAQPTARVRKLIWKTLQHS